MTDQSTDRDTEREVGRGRLRKEDARLVTGQTNWTDNRCTAACAQGIAQRLRGGPVRRRGQPGHGHDGRLPGPGGR
ncbi:hypothetical protein SHIRM173S_04849 [Streptomyces hirsutus]